MSQFTLAYTIQLPTSGFDGADSALHTSRVVEDMLVGKNLSKCNGSGVILALHTITRQKFTSTYQFHQASRLLTSFSSLMSLKSSRLDKQNLLELEAVSDQQNTGDEDSTKQT